MRRNLPAFHIVKSSYAYYTRMDDGGIVGAPVTRVLARSYPASRNLPN